MTKIKHVQVYDTEPADEHIVRRALKRVQDIVYNQAISPQMLVSLQALRSQFLSEVDSTSTCLSPPSHNIVLPQSVNTWLIRRSVEDVLFVIDRCISKCHEVIDECRQPVQLNTMDFLPTPNGKSASDYEKYEIEVEIDTASYNLLHDIYDRYFKN